MIREALEKKLLSDPGWKLRKELWVSDLGYHPQGVMARVLEGKRKMFDLETRVKMQSGNVLEADTLAALQFAYGGVLSGFALYDDVWSGSADFVMGHGTSEVFIVEHKATGDRWWDYKGSLPRINHVCQLWMYGRLYEKMFGVEPHLILYYRAWGHYAELDIVQQEASLMAVGVMDDVPVRRRVEACPNWLRLELEDFFHTNTVPDDMGIDEDTWDYAQLAWPRLQNRFGAQYRPF